MQYPNNELQLLSEIKELMKNWKQSVSLHGDFTSDGFYPYYTHQPIKILFMGRESRGLSNLDYIEILYEAYKNNRIGKTSLNRNAFHRRMLYLAHGIMNNFPSLNNVPKASEIAKNFATTDGISFAFMNISKTSNESENYSANWKNINQSIKDACNGKFNFIKEEIQTLSPDIIIGSGVDNLLETIKCNYKLLEENKLRKIYELWLNHKKINFLIFFIFQHYIINLTKIRGKVLKIMIVFMYL